MMIRLFESPRDCCGCGTCQAACPNGAIAMKPDSKGFLYPEVDASLCTGCGICLRACPLKAGEDRILPADRLDNPLVYAARHTSDEVRLASTSGGMFTALSDAVLEDGGAVYGACFNSGFGVCHRRAATKSERDLFRGSKYVQSDMSLVYRAAAKDLCSSIPVLFTGTPCQAAALKRFLDATGTVSRGLFLCDLVCHGVTSPAFWRGYLSFMEKRHRGHLVEVHFRSKDFEDLKTGMKMVFCSPGAGALVEYKRDFMSDSFFGLYNDGLITRDSCHACRFAGLHRPSDITIGDFWGIRAHHPEFDDGRGVSLVLVNTRKGALLLSRASGRIVSLASSLSECLPRQPQLSGPCPMHPRREKFWSEYLKKGVAHVLRKYTAYGFLFRLKRRSASLLYAWLKKLGLLGVLKRLLGRGS